MEGNVSIQWTRYTCMHMIMIRHNSVLYIFYSSIIIMNQAHMRTACDRVHINKHMQNEVNKAIISMGSSIVNRHKG